MTNFSVYFFCKTEKGGALNSHIVPPGGTGSQITKGKRGRHGGREIQ